MEITASWLSLLPPLVAIGLALWLRQVLAALAAGVWLGASLLAGGNPAAGLLTAVDRFAVGAVADADHAAVIVFSLLLGGMVGVIAKVGGAHGLATVVTRRSTGRRSAQLVTWGLGMLIFFDDYSNSLLIGTSMRPVTDRLRISREKLAFLVDATAAPVASLAIVSSWIGVELGYIGEQLHTLGLAGDPMTIFIQTLPFRFYPILMLLFGLLVAASGRDFGPMLRAERRVLREGVALGPRARPVADFGAAVLEPPAGKPQRWLNAALPVGVVVAAVILGMWWDGRSAVLAGGGQPPSFGEAFARANSYRALLWASLLGCLTALGLAIGQRILRLTEALEAWMAGLRAMLPAVLILVLAWSLGATCRELGTARFLVGALGDHLPAGLLPGLVFALAALISFATGTSWGTMGILFPLVVPLAVELAPGHQVVLLSTIASVLTGSVWGDHCSPISDTTILSSLASSCDHVDHVRTQLPYALAVGGISLVLGDLATGLGWWNVWLALALGGLAVVGLVWGLGRRVNTTG